MKRDDDFQNIAQKYNLRLVLDYKTAPTISWFGGESQKLRTLEGAIASKKIVIQDQISVSKSPLPLKYIPTIASPATSTNGFRTMLYIDGVETDISNRSFWSFIALTPVKKIEAILESMGAPQ